MFDEWLSRLRQAGKGPVSLLATRNAKFLLSITLDGDFTDATMRGEVRLAPDTPGAALAGFTVTGPVVVNGVSTFSVSLSQATVEALPADDDGSGDVVLAFDLLLTPDGGDEEMLVGGEFIVAGGVTQ